jgi:hypothetical protein
MFISVGVQKPLKDGHEDGPIPPRHDHLRHTLSFEIMNNRAAAPRPSISRVLEIAEEAGSTLRVTLGEDGPLKVLISPFLASYNRLCILTR